MLRTRALLGYAVLASVDTVLAAGSPRLRRARLVTKPLLMPALAAAVAASDHRVAGRLQAAQVFSWGGDVALLGSGRPAFLSGLGSFFAAHLAYVSAFRSRSESPLLATRGRRTALAAGAAFALAMGTAAHRRAGLGVPVTAYGLVLTTMAVSSTTVPDQVRPRVLAGTSLFLLSDALIGVTKFVLHERSAPLEAAVMATYAAGQWCIADGMSAA